jgi:FixJ family two-component response regulator
MVEPARVVLVVDDYESMRNAIDRLLEAAGFDCITYASGEALLERGAVGGAVCVVSDLKMPGMSGFELLTEMVVRGGFPPAILMTARDAPGVREEALRRGAVGYLTKPFESSALLAAIERVVGPHP